MIVPLAISKGYYILKTLNNLTTKRGQPFGKARKVTGEN